MSIGNIILSFGGNSASTSSFLLRIKHAVFNLLCNSSKLDAPEKSQPNGPSTAPQYRFANVQNPPIESSLSNMSSCDNNSFGLFNNGVPVRANLYFIFLVSSFTPFVRRLLWLEQFDTNILSAK